VTERPHLELALAGGGLDHVHCHEQRGRGEGQRRLENRVVFACPAASGPGAAGEAIARMC
jgi:hypothetical protein